MEMIEVKTAELSGLALDWAVDAVETGTPLEVVMHKSGSGEWVFFHGGVPFLQGPAPCSTGWKDGGPLLDKYRIGFGLYNVKDREYLAITGLNDVDGSAYGPTHLIAACRAIVAANLGDTVQVPAVLVSA